MAFDPIRILSDRFAAAIRAAFPALGDAPIDTLVAASRQPEHADFQCNAAMPLGKRLGLPPRDVATKIVAHADVHDIAEPLTDKSIAGPGFINIRLRGDALATLVSRMDSPGLGLTPAAPPRRIVVDLMGVNLAKQMHVGHLRSPVIGDAIARTLERLGHSVIRQNHVGDWGLPIAMVTARLQRQAAGGLIDLDRLTLDDLDRAYREAQGECQRDTAGLDAVRRYGLGPKAAAELEEQVAGATEAFTRARETLVRLQAKEPATYAVWKRIADVTMKVCLDTCRRLHVNVTAEHSAGESSYADELSPMVDDLVSRGVAVPDQGALVVRLDEPGTPWADLYGVIKEPCLIRKTDGGYLYATTDVCAIRRRVQKLGAHRAVYVIDARQNLHLRQVFASSLKAGYSVHPQTREPARLEHAAFGAVLGEDGRPFKTRSGESVRLGDLIQETIDRATAAVRERSPDLSPGEAAAIAEAVGVTALKYADLCNDRARDYAFSFDRMLAFEGNTGPYLLYALVRIRSIFRKAAERGAGDAWRTAPFRVHEHAEKSLALALLRYPGVLAAVGETLDPHRLCQYLYDLAGAFAVFFDRCPVVQSEPPVRDPRLRLCDLTARVLADALGVLGLPVPERM